MCVCAYVVRDKQQQRALVREQIYPDGTDGSEGGAGMDASEDSLMTIILADD